MARLRKEQMSQGEVKERLAVDDYCQMFIVLLYTIAMATAIVKLGVSAIMLTDLA